MPKKFQNIKNGFYNFFKNAFFMHHKLSFNIFKELVRF